MRRSTLSGLFGFFALLLALTADLSAANQEPPFKLETGWLPEHETFLIWYAKQKGWDKQEGLDIVLNRFDSGKDLIGNADKWVIGACGAFPILTSHYPEQFTIIGVGNLWPMRSWSGPTARFWIPKAPTRDIRTSTAKPTT